MDKRGSKKPVKKRGRYDEPKKYVGITLTESAIQNLDSRASQLSLARSELIELLSRGKVTMEEAKILGESLAG